MNARRFYLVLCVLGLLIPNGAFWPWLLAHGPDLRLFLGNLFANGVSTFFALDVILSAVAFTSFVFIEGRRLDLERRWVPILATCAVGVSFGLPLFLYQRQLKLDRGTRSVEPLT